MRRDGTIFLERQHNQSVVHSVVLTLLEGRMSGLLALHIQAVGVLLQNVDSGRYV